MNDIQTILVESEEKTRIALRVALRSQPGIEVASEATNGTTGLVLLESIDVDVAIVDAHLPDMSIREFIQQMHDLQIEATVKPSRLLILLDPNEPAIIVQTLAMHVEGYCLKNASVEQMAAAIRQIDAGNSYIDLGIAKHLLSV
ncbi:response regulator transcription factor [Tumidithrix elongata RA019]|uniref:Response regulator transcription factor n=1 Tax=Tumidithrix elongata BACA0141 TaxID=2716417 RepID=A0AAW9PX10_9CYAN|nr:response regulator transcription factor [Tumidithrix elongata RA019]